MPAELWQAAAELVPAHGFHAVMRELRLGYVSLKRQVRGKARERPRAEQHALSPAFIDLGIGGVSALPQCRVIVDDGAGGKLRIELRSTSSDELASLVHAFVNGRRA